MSEERHSESLRVNLKLMVTFLSAFSLHVVAIIEEDWITITVNRAISAKFIIKAGFWDYCIIKGSLVQEKLDKKLLEMCFNSEAVFKIKP